MGGVLLLSSCAGVVIDDSEWCGSLGPEGAACFHTLTCETETLSLQQFAMRWDDLTNPLVCTNASALADLKSDIEKLCTFEQNCTADMQTTVNALFTKVQAAQTAALKAAPKEK